MKFPTNKSMLKEKLNNICWKKLYLQKSQSQSLLLRLDELKMRPTSWDEQWCKKWQITVTTNP